MTWKIWARDEGQPLQSCFFQHPQCIWLAFLLILFWCKLLTYQGEHRFPANSSFSSPSPPLYWTSTLLDPMLSSFMHYLCGLHKNTENRNDYCPLLLQRWRNSNFLKICLCCQANCYLFCKSLLIFHFSPNFLDPFWAELILKHQYFHCHLYLYLLLLCNKFCHGFRMCNRKTTDFGIRQIRIWILILPLTSWVMFGRVHYPLLSVLI